jgi:hypothetical protein
VLRLLGFVALQQGLLPRAASVVLILSALAFMFGFNTEDARAAMAAPFGMVWIWLGYVLWSGPERQLTDTLTPA